MSDEKTPPENHPHGEERSETEREKERRREERKYTSVIVKRTDEARRHPDDILELAIEEGELQHRRGNFSLILSAITAGMILGFTAMSVGVVMTLTLPLGSDALMRIACALVYPLGFVVCVMSASELFTEHTATAVYPVLDRRASIPSLVRVWVFVLLGNLIGAMVSACLLVLAEPVVHAKEGYAAIGEHLTGYGFGPLFVSALLAGWLMALGGWLILATPPTISQMAAIFTVTFLIGLGGLHHSIAGAVEIFTAYLLSDTITQSEVASFLGTAILGNLVGGSIFVSVLNYAHIRQTQIE